MESSPLIWLVLGLAVLLIAAEVLVRGAARLARAAGLSPLVVGLTVVSWGSSSPELAVSIESSLHGATDIAVGNVVGSNIANVLLILGIGASITPLVVSRRIIRLDVPLMIGTSAALMVLGLDGVISRVDGGLLVFALGVATATWVRLGRESGKRGEAERIGGIWRNGAYVVLGVAGLWIAAGWIIGAAVEIATEWGLSELIVGLTIVAVGTSLPEIAVSVVATIRGEPDLAVGNVVGSNIFNILGVLGLAALAGPEGLSIAPAALRFDLPVMLTVAIACLPVFFTGGRINRFEGAVFLAYYAAYLAFLLMQATHHAALPAFSAVMLLFVIPLTVLTLLVVTGRAVWRRASS